MNEVGNAAKDFAEKVKNAVVSGESEPVNEQPDIVVEQPADDEKKEEKSSEEWSSGSVRLISYKNCHIQAVFLMLIEMIILQKVKNDIRKSQIIWKRWDGDQFFPIESKTPVSSQMFRMIFHKYIQNAETHSSWGSEQRNYLSSGEEN